MSKVLSERQIGDFRQKIYEYYAGHGREIPLEEIDNPYAVFVSEIMLQQTQTERVLKKYTPFLHRFPDFRSLAAADTAGLLKEWSGLGYNRRALGMREAAVLVMTEYGGMLPDTFEDLLRLPGVGPATAGEISAFAFSRPVVFIETNIRRVFINEFFEPESLVHDREIFPLISETLDRGNPRRWYYALMDYGSMLASKISNPNRRSSHYSRQTTFEGSNRQLRGKISKTLVAGREITERELADTLGSPYERVEACLSALEREGFLSRGENVVKFRQKGSLEKQ